MLRHLETKDNDPTLAFSPDGIDEMNRNILILNKGKKHQPIYKVRAENYPKKTYKNLPPIKITGIS